MSLMFQLEKYIFILIWFSLLRVALTWYKVLEAS